jgi:hypothetical protein
LRSPFNPVQRVVKTWITSVSQDSRRPFAHPKVKWNDNSIYPHDNVRNWAFKKYFVRGYNFCSGSNFQQSYYSPLSISWTSSHKPVSRTVIFLTYFWDIIQFNFLITRKKVSLRWLSCFQIVRTLSPLPDYCELCKILSNKELVKQYVNCPLDKRGACDSVQNVAENRDYPTGIIQPFRKLWFSKFEQTWISSRSL